tara:strand:- start:105 stop:800 length:696 start_codon:yes stop_codon:yes gene_type:complete
MKRKDFLATGIVGLGGVIALTSAMVLKSEDKKSSRGNSENCALSPKETKGPFPNKTPADYVRENIIGDRKGVALLMNLTILNKNNGCKPFENATVDVWHCDSDGKYSEYGGYGMQREDLTKSHFLRGRKTTDAKGNVSFISIFPGFYQGRAPHIHIEVLSNTSQSLLVTQIAFPEDICNTVYTTEHYQGTSYVSNTRDGIFRDSLEQNMVDELKGNTKDGYTLLKNIIVSA